MKPGNRNLWAVEGCNLWTAFNPKALNSGGLQRPNPGSFQGFRAPLLALTLFAAAKSTPIPTINHRFGVVHNRSGPYCKHCCPYRSDCRQGSTCSLIIGLYSTEDSKLGRNVWLKCNADKQWGQSKCKGHLGLASSWNKFSEKSLTLTHLFNVLLERLWACASQSMQKGLSISSPCKGRLQICIHSAYCTERSV